MFKSKSTSQVDMANLAQLDHNGKIQLLPEALEILQKFVEGQIHFISLEGFQNKQYKISQSFTKSKIRTHTTGNKIWIRSEPVFSQKTKKYYFYIQSSFEGSEGKELFHTFLSLVSETVVIAIEPEDSVGYLGGIQGKISDGLSNTKYFDGRTKSKMAQLLGLMPEQDRNSSSREYFDDVTDKFLEKLSAQGVENEVIASYPLVKCLSCPKKDLEYSSTKLEKSLIDQTQILSLATRSNSEIMYGPIVVEYMKNIVEQLNYEGQVNIDDAQNNIEIDEAYAAYMAGVDKFHKVSLESINEYQRPDDKQLTAAIDLAKKKSLEQYYDKGGASNLKYKKLLDNYLEHKQLQVRSAYSSDQNAKNLQILEVESKIVMERIKNEGKSGDRHFINSQIEAMRRNYESEARGPNKYNLLNDYLKVFGPIAYGFSDKYQVYNANKQKNKALQKKLKQLKAKQGCCAGKCQIM